MKRLRDWWVSSRHSKLIPHITVLAGVLVLGPVLSVWLFHVQYERKEIGQRQELERASRESIELLSTRLLASIEILESISAFFETTSPEKVTREEFRTFVQPALARQPELQALEWIPRVMAADQGRFESAAHADGLSDFCFKEINANGQLQAVGPRAQYFPVFYLEPFESNAGALGVDLDINPTRHRAMLLAALSGQPEATRPVRLMQGASTQPGFLVFVPARDATKNLAGFSLAVLRVDRLAEASLAPLVANGFSIEIRDAEEPEDILCQEGPVASASPAFSQEEKLLLAGRTWLLRVRPSHDLINAALSPDVWIPPASVALASSFLAAYLVSNMRRLREVEGRVAEKTAALAYEAELRCQAEEAKHLAERAQEELRLINAGKDVFFSVLAHDLKNPMGGLLGLSEALVEMLPEDADEAVREFAFDIRNTASQVGDLLLDLLSWAQMQLGKLEPAPEEFFIAKEVEAAVALVGVAARAKKIVIVNEITEPFRVHCDTRMNNTVLRNLLSNAVKFTPSGGTIRVSAEKVESELVITVADSGKGIPADRLPGLFRLGENQTTFGTGGEKGTGLGLPLSREMVEKNGGRLWVESTVGEGSRFHFSVPLAEGE